MAQTPNMTNRSKKRSNEHLTPQDMAKIKKSKDDFFKENGASIFVYIFKEDLRMMEEKEINEIQKKILEKELDCSLEINTTKNTVSYSSRAMILRVHTEEDRILLQKTIKEINEQWTTWSTTDKPRPDHEDVLALVPKVLGEYLDRGQFPKLIKNRIGK